jgi:hypothetical protein
MQRRSAAELRQRRATAVAAVRSVADLEHVNAFHLVDDDRVVHKVPTYRGEGHSFL